MSFSIHDVDKTLNQQVKRSEAASLIYRYTYSWKNGSNFRREAFVVIYNIIDRQRRWTMEKLRGDSEKGCFIKISPKEPLYNVV